MKSDVERKTAAALDLLSPIQIVAWCAGFIGMGDRIRSHPHPRRTNAAARGNTADAYQMALFHELFYGLKKRDPEKARRVAREMRSSQVPALETMAHELEDKLPADAV
jgi:hypothetical protein